MLEEMNAFLEDNSGDISLESSLTPELEGEIFLLAMEESCTPEEFYDIVIEGAVELEMYGLIPRSEMVSEIYDTEEDMIGTEAAKKYNKKIIVKQSKDDVYNRILHRSALRLAKAANSADWKKYKKGRTMMLEAREEIYRKFGSKAAQVTKQAMRSSATKAATMGNIKGASIVDKMDNQIAKMQPAY